MKKVQVGIDLGTTNALACCRVKGKMKLLKFKGKQTLPSVLYVEKQPDGTLKEIIGKPADLKGSKDPDNCIRSSKTYIGLTGVNKKTWTCHGRTYTPTDVAERILTEVHKKVRDTYDLEEDDIVQAVITVPAYFTSNQSDETKRAGENAGLEVVRIITEPVAAAVAAAEDICGRIFIVDLGGGTFDVSVLDVSEEKYKTLEINGERKLGGDDFDKYLMKYLLKYIEDDLSIDLSCMETSGLDYENYYKMMSKIRAGAVELKEELSESDEASVDIPELFTYGPQQKSYNFSMPMEREEFNKICAPLFERILNVIEHTVQSSSKFRKEELTKIFLVGGSCYIPKVQEDVERYFGFPASAEYDRATQVALGAGKIADAWNGYTPDQNRIDPFEDKLQDIISHSMGIEALDEYNRSVYAEILKSGSSYPCVYKDFFQTSHDYQESVIIKVYEKTDSKAADFIDEKSSHFDFYGSFVLEGIDPAPAGERDIEVTFSYDQSRTLHVSAEDKSSHKAKRVELHKGEVLAGTSTDSQVPATDFYILLDVSGSMSGLKIEEAKDACRKLIDQTLDLSIHRLGLIIFGSKAKELCELTNNQNQLLRAVDGVYISGSTNMYSAIKKAKKIFHKIKGNRAQAVILITDGEPDDYRETLNIAEAAREDNISIATIGVEGARQDYLKELSQDDNLNFMADNLEKLSDIFSQAVANLLRKMR